jgi:predicted amidohydrolase
MKILIHQIDTKWLKKEENILRVEQSCLSNDEVDLYLLPEMFNTGYVMSPEMHAESIDDSFTINCIKDLLKNKKTVIGGSIPTKNGDEYFNTFVFINEKGVINHYSKIHLFKIAGEDRRYSAGTNTNIFSLSDVKIKSLICYDLRFPYISFQNKNEHYDLLIYSANWPSARIEQWKKLLIARAIENQCFVIGINRIGMDNHGYEYPGNSLVVDYTGDILLNCEYNEVNVVDLDFSPMYAYRKKLNFLDDIVEY